MSPPSARQHALTDLLRIERDGAFVARLGGVGAEAMDARDQRLAAHYVAGVTRQKRWLDFLIAQFYHGDLALMEPTLRAILRLGVYDVLELGTPPHAAVSEAVGLAHRLVNPGAGKLVNGVLRALLRQHDALPSPQTGDAIRDLAIRHSMPNWIVRRWVQRWGRVEAEVLLRACNALPVFGLRPNGLRVSPDAFRADLDAAGIAWEASPWLEDFVRVPRLHGLLQTGWLEAGRCAVQDEAAALVVRLLDPQPGETVADLCAAPGGKALYTALRMGDAGTVRAFDLHPGKLALVDRAAASHGLTSVTTAVGDFTRDDAPTFNADRVLLDAPCSGLGVLAKRADLRWRRTPDDLAELTHLQDRLLDAAALRVRPGGVLVYATCTAEPEENEDRVQAFLHRHSSFSRESAHGLLPAPVVTPEGYYAALPHRHGTDGAFAARLRRIP